MRLLLDKEIFREVEQLGEDKYFEKVLASESPYIVIYGSDIKEITDKEKIFEASTGGMGHYEPESRYYWDYGIELLKTCVRYLPVFMFVDKKIHWMNSMIIQVGKSVSDQLIKNALFIIINIDSEFESSTFSSLEKYSNSKGKEFIVILNEYYYSQMVEVFLRSVNVKHIIRYRVDTSELYPGKHFVFYPPVESIEEYIKKSLGI